MQQPSVQNGQRSHGSQRRTEHSSSWLGGPPGRQLQGKETAQKGPSLASLCCPVMVPPLCCGPCKVPPFQPMTQAQCSLTYLSPSEGHHRDSPISSKTPKRQLPSPLQWDIWVLCGMTRVDRGSTLIPTPMILLYCLLHVSCLTCSLVGLASLGRS